MALFQRPSHEAPSRVTPAKPPRARAPGPRACPRSHRQARFAAGCAQSSAPSSAPASPNFRFLRNAVSSLCREPSVHTKSAAPPLSPLRCCTSASRDACSVRPHVGADGVTQCSEPTVAPRRTPPCGISATITRAGAGGRGWAGRGGQPDPPMLAYLHQRPAFGKALNRFAANGAAAQELF